MRNGGMVAGTLGVLQDADAISLFVSHTVLTHHNRLVVLYSVIHGLLVRHLLQLANQQDVPVQPFDKLFVAWLRDVCMPLWIEWCATGPAFGNKTVVCTEWLRQSGFDVDADARRILCDKVCSQLDAAVFEQLNPYTHKTYKDQAGWCVLSMQIALWSVHWSEQPAESRIEPLPEWAQGEKGVRRHWILAGRGFEAIRMLAVIGADSDTYAAIAGPLLAAKFPDQTLKSHNAGQLRKDALIAIESVLECIYAPPEEEEDDEEAND